MVLLKLDGINKVFNEGTPDEKIALDNINLECENCKKILQSFLFVIDVNC